MAVPPAPRELTVLIILDIAAYRGRKVLPSTCLYSVYSFVFKNIQKYLYLNYFLHLSLRCLKDNAVSAQSWASWQIQEGSEVFTSTGTRFHRSHVYDT